MTVTRLPALALALPPALALSLLLAGCGDSGARPADQIPPVRLSHSTIDRELTDAGVGAQLIQSLSETAQSAKYDRVQFQTVSWRRSQDLALVALHRCRAAGKGTSTWASYVAADERRPRISHDAAVRVNHFMEQEFCAALTR